MDYAHERRAGLADRAYHLDMSRTSTRHVQHFKELPLSRRGRHPGGVPKVRDYQWSIVVDAKLDKAAKAAAKEAGLPLAAWVRQVVKKQLGLPVI